MVEPEVVVSSPNAQASVSPNSDLQQEAQRIYKTKSLYALHVNLPTLAIETDYLHDSWFTPKNGEGYTLTNEDFYELLGNTELYDQYIPNRKKMSLSSALIVSGTVVAIGSAA